MPWVRYHAAAYADPMLLSVGFHRAMLIAGALCAFWGVLAFVTISDAGLGEPGQDVAVVPVDDPGAPPRDSPGSADANRWPPPLNR